MAGRRARLWSSLLLAAAVGCPRASDDEGAPARDPDVDEAGPGDEDKGDAQVRADGPGDAAGDDEAGGSGDAPRSSVIVRAETAAAVSAKGAKSLGFSLKKLVHLFALDATARVPDWGLAGETEPGWARDDDLYTAWTCRFDGEATCVLGLTLPEPARVEVLRLYGAAGPRYATYKSHPRIASVRVHTAAGYLDATVSDGAGHVYVRFDEPVETRTLAIEITGVHPGSKDALVHLAEVEVYGTDGAPRAPLEFDPELAWTNWETEVWAGEGQHTARQLFIDYAVPGQPPGEDGRPATKRLLRGTAVFGRSDDDYVLLERMYGSDCDDHRGSYVLLDRRNRMVYPLGELGGAGGQVFRHAAGRGFAVGWTERGRASLKGVVEEAGDLEWRRLEAGEDPAARLAAWGFDPEPLPRGRTLGSPPTGCHRAGATELGALQSATSLPAHADTDASHWLRCDVEGSSLWVQGVCGDGALAYLTRGRRLLGEHASVADDPRDRGFRVRRIGDRMLVELSDSGGANSSLYWVTADAMVSLGEHAGLAARPPEACERCVDGWRR